jgi:hypothetical protein
MVHCPLNAQSFSFPPARQNYAFPHASAFCQATLVTFQLHQSAGHAGMCKLAFNPSVTLRSQDEASNFGGG